MMRTLVILITGIAAIVENWCWAEKPVKVYMLAGQSNMEGHAKVETFDYIGDDPVTVPLLTNARNGW